MLSQIFVLAILIWCFQETFSSKYNPRNFLTIYFLSGTLSMCRGSKIFGIYFLFLVEWNKIYFIFETFKESLLALKRLATFLSPSLIALKRFPIPKSEINKFASSTNITGDSLLKLLKRSFIHMRNKSGSRMEPCSTPQVILRHNSTVVGVSNNF